MPAGLRAVRLRLRVRDTLKRVVQGSEGLEFSGHGRADADAAKDVGPDLLILLIPTACSRKKLSTGRSFTPRWGGSLVSARVTCRQIKHQVLINLLPQASSLAKQKIRSIFDRKPKAPEPVAESESPQTSGTPSNLALAAHTGQRSEATTLATALDACAVSSVHNVTIRHRGMRKPSKSPARLLSRQLPFGRAREI